MSEKEGIRKFAGGFVKKLAQNAGHEMFKYMNASDSEEYNFHKGRYEVYLECARDICYNSLLHMEYEEEEAKKETHNIVDEEVWMGYDNEHAAEAFFEDE